MYLFGSATDSLRKPARSVALVFPCALARAKSALTSSSGGPVLPLDFAAASVWQPPQPESLKTARPGLACEAAASLGASLLAFTSHDWNALGVITWMFLKNIWPWPEPHSSVHCTS